MRRIDRRLLPSTRPEIPASFFSLESFYISAPQFPLGGRLGQADNRGCEAMIPACRVVVSGPLEIRVSIGSYYLRSSLVEAAYTFTPFIPRRHLETLNHLLTASLHPAQLS